MKLHEVAAMDVDDSEAWNMDEHKLMEQYPEEGSGEEPQYVAITEIVVPTERDKDQLLRAIKYLHDNRTIDTNYYAVNTLVHMYNVPELIRVRS